MIGVGAIVAAVAFALLAWYGSGYGGGGNGYGDSGYGYMMGGGGVFWIWMLLPGAFFLVLLFVLIFAVLTPSTSSYAPAHSLPSAPSPREQLEGRYVRGEIMREDYLRMKSDLETTSPGGRA